MKKNILLIYGGGGTEHEVSQVSANFLKSQMDEHKYNIVDVEIKHDGSWKKDFDKVEINFDGELLINGSKVFKIDLVIPCLHGFPGETGDLQSFLEMVKVPYIGSNSESSKLCFNKISTKLWLESSQVPTTPFLIITSPNDEQLELANQFFDKHKALFIKASSQGSSVGCFPVKDKEELADTIVAAYALSPYVVVEKEVVGRELEVSVFEYENAIHCTVPGEIICPSQFYSYEEKYDHQSSTKTDIEAKGLTAEQINKIKTYALAAFDTLKLRHLSRIDFFLTSEGEIYINEINTFPGLTPISMFPKMMENYGIEFKNFIAQIIEKSLE